MKKIILLLEEIIKKEFNECGYDEKYGKVIISNRPDLCEYQCDGALTAAKEYKQPPFMIADEVVAKCNENEAFEKIEVVKPGFINITVSNKFLTNYCNEMNNDVKFGCKM